MLLRVFKLSVRNRWALAKPVERSLRFYETNTTRWGKNIIKSSYSAVRLTQLYAKACKCHIYTINAADVWGTMPCVSGEHLIKQLHLQLLWYHMSTRLVFNQDGKLLFGPCCYDNALTMMGMNRHVKACFLGCKTAGPGEMETHFLQQFHQLQWANKSAGMVVISISISCPKLSSETPALEDGSNFICINFPNHQMQGSPSEKSLFLVL